MQLTLFQPWAILIESYETKYANSLRVFFAFLMMQFFGGWTKPAYDVYKQQMTHMAPEIKTQWPVFG